MVLEVYVPFAVAEVRGVLAEPERAARCLPGFQPGPGEPLRGARLRLRVAGSTITYRGEVTVSERGDGFGVEAEGGEARGDGTIRVALELVPRPVTGGAADGDRSTTLTVSGTVEGTGRLAGVEAEQREAAARRLLDRFGEALAAELAAGAAQARPLPPPAGGIGAPDDNEPAIPGIPAPESGPDAGADQDRPGRRDITEAGSGLGETARDDAALGDAAPEDVERGEEQREDPAREDPAREDPAREEAELADAALEARLEEDALAEEFGERIGDGLVEDLARAGTPVEPEADVARRTMIGRSAEEVDHAPPRGRYAPVPAPGRAPAAAATMRWAAPVAALAVASAVVVGRLLRRRR